MVQAIQSAPLPPHFPTLFAQGLGHLNPPFVISRMGGDGDRLPTAHTCFNHLLLPQYSSKEVLRQRLECALDNAEGFGLM